MQLLENASSKDGVIAVKIRKQPDNVLSSDPSEPIKGDKLQSYFNLAVKCLQNIFASLGISYMFKLVTLPAHKKKDLLVVLDVLKHAYGLLFFMETF